jgi:hypothetical protein
VTVTVDGEAPRINCAVSISEGEFAVKSRKAVSRAVAAESARGIGGLPPASKAVTSF